VAELVPMAALTVSRMEQTKPGHPALHHADAPRLPASPSIPLRKPGLRPHPVAVLWLDLPV
jgi:hypothetical protein